jgi:hypothetical protein
VPRDFDIIVRDKGSSEVRLICEVKMSPQQIASGEIQLKQAMARLSCPLGLLFTPEILRVYSDEYTSDNPTDSVELIGEFDSRSLLGYTRAKGANPQSEQAFQSDVQRWLEALPQSFSSDALGNEPLAAILTTFIIPAVASGQVSAAAPRYL